jgi:hypothetical protein
MDLRTALCQRIEDVMHGALRDPGTRSQIDLAVRTFLVENRLRGATVVVKEQGRGYEVAVTIPAGARPAEFIRLRFAQSQ